MTKSHPLTAPLSACSVRCSRRPYPYGYRTTAPAGCKEPAGVDAFGGGGFVGCTRGEQRGDGRTKTQLGHLDRASAEMMLVSQRS